MRIRYFLNICFMLLGALLILTGCGGEKEAEPDAAVSPETSGGDSIAQSSPVSDDGDGPLATTDSPFYVATAADDGPIVKDVETGPVSTQAPAPSSTFDADGDGFYSYDELKQAVTQLMSTYDWPQNYQVTPDLMLRGFDSTKNARWEAPYEYTLVGFFHICSWERAWLDAYRAGDQELLDTSLSQLRMALDNFAFEGIRDDLKARFDSAALGDPALIQQDVDNFCSSGYPFITPVPNTPAANIAPVEGVVEAKGHRLT